MPNTKPTAALLEALLIAASHLSFLSVGYLLAVSTANQANLNKQFQQSTKSQQSAIVRVVDGDTVLINYQLLGDLWLKDAPMRLYGIDCPELNTPEGKQAKAFTEKWIVENSRTLKITLQLNRDKYGRLLGEVGTLNQDLKTAGLAKDYP